MNNEYKNASSVEEVKNTPGTCFLDETNTFHIHSPNHPINPEYGYRYFKNWQNYGKEKPLRGELVRTRKLSNEN